MKKDNDDELLPHVDREGNVLGSVKRGEAHSGKKILHPVVHLHLFNTKGELYLQLRPLWKTVQPGKWDTACGGHIAYGESVEDALRREVYEELGISDFEAEKVTSYIFESQIDAEYVYVFKALYDGDVCPSREELSGGRFFSREEIAEKMGKGFFTPNFESEYKTYIENCNSVILRKATERDARFVAWTVLTALDMNTDDMEKAVNSCLQEDSLYSWKQAFLATVNDKPVGCLIAYDGVHYKERRNRTWEAIWGELDEEYLRTLEPETNDGEYYLDSIAILPEYRGKNIGKKLLQYAMSQREQQDEPCTLIVSQDKPHLQSYYESIGFEPFGQMELFGHIYTRMMIRV